MFTNVPTHLPCSPVVVLHKGKRKAIERDLSVALRKARGGKYPPGSVFVRLKDGVLLGCTKTLGDRVRPEHFVMPHHADPDRLAAPHAFDERLT
jgi:hypothetical protein